MFEHKLLKHYQTCLLLKNKIKVKFFVVGLACNRWPRSTLLQTLLQQQTFFDLFQLKIIL